MVLAVMTMAEIETEIDDPRWSDSLPGTDAFVRRAAAAALTGKSGSLAVLLTGDARMRELNRRFRGKDRATNVLAFPVPETIAADALGDLALGFETVEAEARDQGKSFADHTTHLIVHGSLHLVGYTHEALDDAARMEETERRLLAEMGIADPYCELAGEDDE